MLRILLLSLIVSLNIFSQNLQLRIIKTDTEKFPVITTAIQVYDAEDEPITGLKPENFVTSLSGNSGSNLQVITHKESGQGLEIVLCLDISLSMTGKPLQSIKNSANEFIDKLRNVDKLAILTFSDDVEIVADFSSNKDFLKNKINEITAKGNRTELFYGSYKGIEHLKNTQSKAGKMLMLISDGHDESKTRTYSVNDVINVAKENSIPVFSIGYTTIDKAYLQNLEKISAETNGKYYFSPSDSQLEQTFNKLYNQLLNIYLVSYKVLDMPGDGNTHNQTVTVKKDKESKSITNSVLVPGGVNAETSPQPVKDSSFIYYLLGGLLVIVAVGTVFFLIKKKKKEEAENERIRIEEEQQRKRNEERVKEEERKAAQTPPETMGKIEPVGSDENTVLDPGSSTKDFNGERTVILGGNTMSTQILTLNFKVGSFAGQSFELNEQGGTIGRADTNTIILKENSVSSKHATVTFSDGDFRIKDENSSNGVFVNGEKVVEKVLNDGNTLKLGSNEAYVKIS